MTEQGLAIKPQQNGRGLSLAEVQAQMKEYAPILREMVQNGKKLTEEQITGRMMFALTQGLDPVTEVNTLVDGSGKTMGNSMHINGFRRKCWEQLGPGMTDQTEFVALTTEQMPPGALYGFECRLRDDQSYATWQKRLLMVGKSLREAMGQAVSFAEIISACGPAPVATGIGIFYKAELNDYKDRNYNPLERCKKRAERNARTRRYSIVAPVYDGDDSSTVINENAIEGNFTDAPPVVEPKHTEAENMSALGFGAPEPAKPAETVDAETGEILQAAQDEGGEIRESLPPINVMAAMERIIGTRTLGDFSIDELQSLVDNKQAAKTLRESATLVLEWAKTQE